MHTGLGLIVINLNGQNKKSIYITAQVKNEKNDPGRKWDNLKLNNGPWLRLRRITKCKFLANEHKNKADMPLDQL